MTKDTKKNLLEETLLKLHGWIQRNGWAGYDPYDLEHRLFCLPKFVKARLCGKSPVGLLEILGRRYPYFMRRVLGVPRRIYPKAMGLFAESYVSMYEHFGDEEYLRVAKDCAQWLVNNVSKGRKGYGWGFPLAWQSRIFFPENTTYAIVSVICGEGLWRLFKCTGEQRYLEYCRMACEGFLTDLNIDQIKKGTVCFSYSPLDHFHIHNSNLWVAAYLVKVGQHLNNREYVACGLEAANYALEDQREDGSLTYWGSDQDRNGHMDHYHSGFEIRALHSLWKLTGRHDFKIAVQRYYEYYKRNFFGEDGVPWRNPGDPTLIDIHGCAEALLCNAQLAKDFPEALELLAKTAKWIIQNMQSPHGYFIYQIKTQKDRRLRVDIPYIRWGQAWMMRGLTAVLEIGEKANDS